MSDATLFGPAPDIAARGGWVAVLDEANVLEWLSSRLLTPKAAFVKHYADVLDVRDDLVPLVRSSVAGGLVAVASSGASGACVLVEVDEAAAIPVGDPRVAVLAPVTFDSVRALHMRSEQQRAEFLARRYENVEVDGLPIEISPELFAGRAPGEEDLRRALRGVARVRTAVDHALADRLGGGRLMAVQAAADDRALRGLVQALLRIPPAKPSRQRARTPADWLVLGPALRRPSARKTASFDRQLYEDAAAEFLLRDRRGVLDPNAVVAAVDARMRRRATLSQDDRERWAKARTWIEGLLSGTRPFNRFRSAEFRAEKALLLALVRSEPTEVLTWREEAIGAHADDLLLAAVLVGLAHGRKTAPVAMRPRTLDEALARRELFDLFPTLEHAPREPVVEVDETAHGRCLSLNGMPIRQLPEQARTTALLASLDLTAPGLQDGILAVCRRKGWADLVRTSVRFDGELQVRPRAGATEIQGAGFPHVSHRVDLAAFRQRLMADADQVVDELSAAVGR